MHGFSGRADAWNERAGKCGGVRVLKGKEAQGTDVATHEGACPAAMGSSYTTCVQLLLGAAKAVLSHHIDEAPVRGHAVT